MSIKTRYKLKTGEEVAYFPPIQNTANPYLTEAAMHADQANQLEGYGYLVDGVGAFTYLGTVAGTAADYEGFGGGSGLDLRASNLAADLSTAEQDALKAKMNIVAASKESFVVAANFKWTSGSNNNWSIFNGNGISLYSTLTTNFITAISSTSANVQVNNYPAPFIAPFDCKIVSARIKFYTANPRTFDFSIGSHSYTDGSSYNADLLNPTLLFNQQESSLTIKRLSKVFTINENINEGDSLIFGLLDVGTPQEAPGIPVYVQFYIQKL